jgi:hypothetical protein
MNRRELLIAIVVMGVLLAVIVPAVREARDTARRTELRNNLHNLGVAMHGYHDVFACLPPGGVIGGDGTPYHGWYCQIAPYVDAAPLYNRINFNVSWDDPENDFLFQIEIPWCLNPSVVERRSPEGYGLQHYLANPHLMHRNSSEGLDDLAAGTEHTWLLGEAGGDFTPFAYPFNWRPLGERLNQETDGYGLPGLDATHLLMADGSVVVYSKDTASDVLRAMAASPPVPTAAAIETPPRPRVYRSSGMREASVDLGGAWAEAMVDRNGVPVEVSFDSWRKGTIREVNAADLPRVAREFPLMQKLVGAPVIDDEAADVLAKLTNLESLEANGISVTDHVIERLASLPKLRSLNVGWTDAESLTRLKEALPECAVVGRPDSSLPNDGRQ